MAVRTLQTENNIIFFCSFTCLNWMNLFKILDFYSEIYKWFDKLKEKKCEIIGYVIMPNHMHLLLFIPEFLSINKLIGNGKRFMAYEIVKQLERSKYQKILSSMEAVVTKQEKTRGKKHRVFQPSFDSKPVYEEGFLIQKLDYIHHNPVSGKWNLVDDFTEYQHSSAGFYELGKEGIYPITHYKDILG
jgi:REP element-mobilizing transposase RayT